jgi:hypothetical protein
MRVLKRHSSESDASGGDDGDTATGTTGTTETTTTTTETSRAGWMPRFLRSRGTTDRAAVAEPTAPPGAETAEPATRPVPARPGWRERFSRTTTVPVTVPKRSIRRTATVPARRVEPAATQPRGNPAAALAVLAGGALAVVGLVALIRAGVDDTWFRPEVEVLGANHTAMLAAVEIGIGAVLLLVGILGSRVLVGMAGIAAALVGTAVAVEPQELSRLAVESWWASVLAAGGVVLALAALYTPRPRVRRDTVIDVR